MHVIEFFVVFIPFSIAPKHSSSKLSKCSLSKQPKQSSKIISTNEAKTIAKHAMELCDLIFKYDYPIRSIRLKMSILTSSNIEQLSMFDNQKKDISTTIVEINKKYGKIFLASDNASFINNSPRPHE